MTTDKIHLIRINRQWGVSICCRRRVYRQCGSKEIKLFAVHAAIIQICSHIFKTQNHLQNVLHSDSPVRHTDGPKKNTVVVSHDIWASSTNRGHALGQSTDKDWARRGNGRGRHTRLMGENISIVYPYINIYA